MIKNIHLCKVEDALEIIVGKWKPVILLLLIQEETMRFSDIQRAIPQVSARILTKQLRELEHFQVISRKVYAEVPPRVEYSITEHGMKLNPILEAMHAWATEQLLVVNSAQQKGTEK